MGREIRRVPPNWQHPKKEYLDHRTMRMVERYQPMFDDPFAPAMREWIKDWEAWEAGERPSYCEGDDRNLPYWEWSGPPPNPAYYRPDWPEGSATWLQMYETVSEGTPVTPPFATPEELIEYLVANGDFWDQSRGDGGWKRENAESFVKDGWAPSGIVVGGVWHAPRDGSPLSGEQKP